MTVRRLWLCLAFAPVLSRADIAQPFGDFVALRAQPGILHETPWETVRGDPAQFRGRTLGYLLLVRGRIDAGGLTRLIGYSRADELIEVVSADGCSVGAPGEWLAVLGILPETGAVRHLIGTAATRIAPPHMPEPPQLSSRTVEVTGGANGAGTGAALPPPGSAAGAAPLPEQETPFTGNGSLPNMPAMGEAPGAGGSGPPPYDPSQLGPQPQQPQYAPGYDPAAQNRLEWYIYERNKRVPAAERQKIAQTLIALSARHRMRWEFMAALVTAESNFNRRAVSTAGALGLGQLMPFNCKTYGVTDPYDIEQNLAASTLHMRELLDRYAGRGATDQFQLAVAAYNAGAGAVARHGGVPPYRETINHVRRVAEYYVDLCRRSSAAVGR